MKLDQLLPTVETAPQSLDFDEVIAAIGFTPTSCVYGDPVNRPGENNGSCRIISFAMMHDLDEQQELHCF